MKAHIKKLKTKSKNTIRRLNRKISDFRFHDFILGGSLRAGLSVASPRAIAHKPSQLRAFHFYPCRKLSKFTFKIFDFRSVFLNRKISGLKFQISNLILFFVLLSFNHARAQVLTLDSVLSMIDQRNPMLQDYDNKVKALNEYSKGATSWMAPMVGAGTFMTPYQNRMATHESDKGSWMFSVEQQIPNPGKLKANRNFLQSRAGVEKHGRAVEFNNLRSEAKLYYLQWLVAEKKLSVLAESERIIGIMLKIAQIRYPYSQGSLGNIYKAEGRLSEVQNMELMTRSEIEDKSFRIKALINLPSSDSIAIDTTTVIDFQYEQIANDTISLSQHRSDIRQLEQTIEVMRLNQQLQRSQAKPDFKIRFDHMQPIGDMPAMFTAMAMVSIPIAPWSSKMYKSEVKGMQYDIEAMNKSRQAILNETKGMLAAMASQLSAMKRQLNNYQTKIVPALRRNYQTLMLAYEENREQLPMVIDGWEALNMAEMDYLDKTEEYYKMMVSYEKQLEK
jgi:cobalt-zinc-cadmium efflux system outer membrane protein